MIKQIQNIIDKSMLKSELVQKQRLYAQMDKDKLHGSAMEKLSREIGQLNLKIYGRDHA